METEIDDDAYMQEFDFDAEGVRLIKHPLTEKMQARAEQAEAVLGLDWDVVEIIRTHAQNPEDMARVNAAIRALFP